MKKLVVILSFVFLSSCVESNKQVEVIDQLKIKEDLNEILTDLSNNYAYIEDKKVDITCLKEHYESKIGELKSNEDKVLFFEYLLDEFYDSHLILNTNTNSSYRLFSPIYTSIVDGKFIISNVWQTQIDNLKHDIIGAEILKINSLDFNEAIQNFPTSCNDKNDLEVKEWIANKILAGRYDQKRLLTLKLSNGIFFDLDLDDIKIKQDNGLLLSKEIEGFGYIRINNSLGENELIKEFDTALDSLMNTKGLILDLRNTVDGGDSYVARGIMGRFIDEPKPYQKHSIIERYEASLSIERSWIEFVTPRLNSYKKPLMVLVGRWTGSMGEGLAIGLDGMQRAEIIGSEMERLAGEVNNFSFKNLNFGYRIPTAKLYHVNGTLREKFVPVNFVQQTTLKKDEVLDKVLNLLKQKTEN